MQTRRRDFLKTGGALVVGFWLAGPAAAAGAGKDSVLLRAPKSVAKEAVESWLVIEPGGHITVFTGKVDLGTGAKTALAQIAADELDVAFDRITMVMGDTATTPDQWLTAGSRTIGQGGAELRKAAATARTALVARAAERFGVPVTALMVDHGVIRVMDTPSKSVDYAELISAGGLQLQVDQKVVLKNHADYKVIGKSIPRVDIPAKVTGEFTYVHDFRLPGMLHARVVRPDDLGAKLLSFDDAAARKVPGFVRTVRKGDFLAVVSRTEWGAIKASRVLKAQWGPGTGLPEQTKVFEHWRQLPVAKEEVTQQVGDAPAALAASARHIKATYEFAVQTHASIGPSCAVADFRDGKLTLWSASQATHSMQDEIASLLSMPKEAVRLVYLDGSGCYGRNGHEDATADAALIATLIGRPVRVQWMRADETARSPKSPPRVIDLEAGVDANGNVAAWSGEFWIALNHVAAFKPMDFPLLAATETGLKKPGNWVGFLHQNSGAPYSFSNIRVNTRHIAETPFRSAHLRSPGRLENSFANESFIDELAFEVKQDPAEYRLKHVSDPRAIAVVRAAMKRADWKPRVGINPAPRQRRHRQGPRHCVPAI